MFDTVTSWIQRHPIWSSLGSGAFFTWVGKQLGIDLVFGSISDGIKAVASKFVGEQGPCEFEEFAYVASSVWQEKTGINPWEDSQGRFPYTGAPPADNPSGIQFKEDADFLSKEYPKLWARFGESPL